MIYLIIAIVFFVIQTAYRQAFLTASEFADVRRYCADLSLVFITGGSKSGFTVLYPMLLAVSRF